MRASLILTGLVSTALAAAAWAQIEGGDRGVAPMAGTSSYEVSGITVDVAARTADEARYGGWRAAQRKAWTQLSRRMGAGGGAVSDGTLDQLVSGIVVENEQIGPTRYIARLGVLFDRARTSAMLGIVDQAAHSSPMLVIPVQVSGGVAQVFEARTDWQEAWARFRTGNSAIDYVRAAGTGPDSLLLTAGQAQRRGRGWWRMLLDQYGASDILIPIVRLQRQWPGGPVIGVFEARHGPDNELLDSFSLRVASADGVAALLDAGVRRMDALYARALSLGALSRDIALTPPPQPVAPPPDEVGDLIDATDTADDAPTAAGAGQAVTVTVQYDSPSAASVANAESTLRGVAGVRSAQTSSLALGGVSLMRVVFDGDPEGLRTALESRGYTVNGSGTTLRIRRAPQLQLPDFPTDDRPSG
ncbi:heavy-metal-associated domain-containing protein [Sphingomonas sp.]|uniref:heavy-metal-associated domain-containing protein n=1 Tax=Sphingomonas sp. TaxID=28214 RepID=UPI003CC5D3D2